MSLPIVIGVAVLVSAALALFLIGGASPRERLKRAILGACLGAAGFGVYALNGSPGLADAPFSAREAELRARDPRMMNDGELLVLFQSLARERPEDAEPHFFTGNLLKEQGRIEEAARAFQSALRRNPGHAPSLLGLADAYVALEGDVTEQSAALYAEAYRQDPTLVRAGFLAELPAWQAGEREGAMERWIAIREALPEGDPRRGMVDALIASQTETGAEAAPQ